MLERLVAREIEYLWSRLARAWTSRGLESLAPMWSPGSDARVTRLVESAGYVFARAREKLEDDLPEVSHALVGSALPEVLRPMPSATVIRFLDAQRERRDVTEHGPLELGSRPIDGQPCLFTTCWPVAAAPIVLAETALRTLEPGRQTLVLRLESYASGSLARALPEPLRVFVGAQNPFHALDVVHAARTSRAPVSARVLGPHGELLARLELPACSVRWTAVDAAPRFLPGRTDRFASGTALRAFHAFPELFAFFDLLGLREAARSAPSGAHAIELAIPLAEPVREDAPVDCSLDCTPAVNVFAAVAAPLSVRGLGSLGPLRAAGHPGAEILDVSHVRLHLARDRATAIDVRLWEREVARPLRDEELYLQLERRASIDRGPTELLATLLRLDGRAASPVGELSADLLATDGLRTEALLRGDIGQDGDTTHVVNVTRVSPPSPPALEARLPWRLNAYARMTIRDFASAASLASYVELHDPRRSRPLPKDDDPAAAGFVSVARTGTYRVERDEVIHGDDVDLVLDEAAFGGRGAAWLVGELVARALAERAEALRFTRARWLRREGDVVADYGRRTGERLPPPFG